MIIFIHRACTKEKKEPPLAFSLITDRNLEESLDFVINSREIYDYWIDALNAVLGKLYKQLIHSLNWLQ